jgi:hypothetical protein
MNPEFYDLMFSIMFPILFGLIIIPILFGLLAIFSFYTGLRAVLTKRPFLISNRWWLSIMFVAFIAMILLNFSLSIPGSFNAMNWVIPLILGLLLLRRWFQLRGYTAYGVTDTSFREALLAALQKLEFSYEESLSVIRLTSIEADLQVSVQSWMGTGIIKVKQRAHQPVLREVVNEMNEYFRISSVPTNMISSVLNLVAGAIVVILAIDMSFFRNIF